MEDFNFDYLAAQIWDILLLTAYAVLALIVGFWIVKRITKLVEKILKKKELDISIQKFLIKLVSVGLKVLVIISVAGLVGIPTTSFVAVIGAAGLAVGLALQGSLANFAGGVLLLFLKPFEVGDFIDGAGESGTVETISIFYTYLNTPKNQLIIIPNAELSNNTITNYSRKPIRRLDLTFGIDYGDDIGKAKSILEQMISNESRILKDPDYQIVVDALGDNAVNIKTKTWCKKEDYWDLNYELLEKVKLEFDKQGISFPFPQRDIHIIKEGDES